MPRRDDLRSILVIGSGPIVIGQACEFDYSGTQACKVLRADGYRVVLLNSNPATIMTDPELADATYVEPLDLDTLTRVIARERPDAVLPTLGGQTALNLAVAAADAGVLDEWSVELIGAGVEAIRTAEDRRRFKEAMVGIGLAVPPSGIAYSLAEAMAVGDELGYPLICRPSFILGGGGTGVAADASGLERVAAAGLAASPVGEILLERSIAGWKEYELEVMRDGADNAVVVCSIENLDPMGVHTGDSITVAPAQTLTDVEYQVMRDAAFACIRRIGVETGGSNIQFAVNPADGTMVVIEMNPRVSRSSALASKATGFPIAKIAARLAVGYRLDEIRNDITGETPASFEPTIDYVVTKIPRFAFEKFTGVPPVLGTKMQSVGEVMAIGRTFPESLQKAVRSLETGRAGLGADAGDAKWDGLSDDELVRRAAVPTPERLFCLEAALRRGITVERLAAATGVDPWFCDQIALVTEERARIAALGPPGVFTRADWRRAKRTGFSDAQIAHLTASSEAEVRRARIAAGVTVTFKTVDTCAAEFAASTPYHYSTWEDEDEVAPLRRPAVVILGSGPNRIGQGIEFDYCCVHAALELSAAGYETVMVNCNPETVSTDYDTSDRLFFEPLTCEDVLNVCGSLDARGGELSLDASRVEPGSDPGGSPGVPGVDRQVVGVVQGDAPESGHADRAGGRAVPASPTAGEAAQVEGGVPAPTPSTARSTPGTALGTAFPSAPTEGVVPATTPDTARSTPGTTGDPLGSDPGSRTEAKIKGLIVSLGGQTPLKLAHDLERAGLRVLGTSPDSIDLAEDRERFNALCRKLGIPQPEGGTATTVDEALAVAGRIGWPVLVRPSYVLGGRAMEIVYDEAALRAAMAALAASADGSAGLSATRPVLVDRFLEDAVEVDVDAVRDHVGAVLIGGIMEHIEQAGVHSGDSACAIPPPTLAPDVVDVIIAHTRALAAALGVVGLLNVQFAVKDGAVSVLEANPRGSRTVPFVAKATGVPLARIAARVMVGATLADLRRAPGADGRPAGTPMVPADVALGPDDDGFPALGLGGLGHVAVKEAALPFERFGVDSLLGPEMRSTGEVMGIDRTFGVAFAKSQAAVGSVLPERGAVFLSLADRDKATGVVAARLLAELGFSVVATAGTARACEGAGIPVAGVVAKRTRDAARRPQGQAAPLDSDGVDAVELIASGKVDLVINTPRGRGPRADGDHIRLAAAAHGVPCLTTVAAGLAAAAGIAGWREDEHRVRSLQEYHRDAQLRLL